MASADPRRKRQVPPPPPPPADEEESTPNLGLDGTSDSAAIAPAVQPVLTDVNEFKLKFCTVCASNNNRYVTFR